MSEDDAFDEFEKSYKETLYRVASRAHTYGAILGGVFGFILGCVAYHLVLGG